MSIALDSRITANLSPARVEALCPPKAAVRALNLCGGVNPSNPPRPAKGFAPPGIAATLRSPLQGRPAPLRRAASWSYAKRCLPQIVNACVHNLRYYINPAPRVSASIRFAMRFLSNARGSEIITESGARVGTAFVTSSARGRGCGSCSRRERSGPCRCRGRHSPGLHRRRRSR